MTEKKATSEAGGSKVSGSWIGEERTDIRNIKLVTLFLIEFFIA